ncbi:hypothetical protein A4G28_04055 [Mycobacterium ostraviense]|uniref:Uncharacterized protein n=1 Tax=Mycobacterium ostraviense TaxID=2738409 RepID=A0A163SZH5_9MYCO|nr:hypothetical protein A4G28_04055 [Mycobacterium ostraviense]
MEVDVRDGLVRRDSVVLPNGNSRPRIGFVDCLGRGAHTYSHRGNFTVGKIQNRFSMCHRDDQKVRKPTLFARDEHGDLTGAGSYRERSSAGKVVAERACRVLGYV